MKYAIEVIVANGHLDTKIIHTESFNVSRIPDVGETIVLDIEDRKMNARIASRAFHPGFDVTEIYCIKN